MGTGLADTNPFRHAGAYLDLESGLYYLKARQYQPSTGRFTSADTYRGDPADPHSLNLYAYCYNSPVHYSDPSGNVPVETVLDIAGLMASAAIMIEGSSVENAAYLVWDVAAVAIPYAPGSYVARGGGREEEPY